MLYFIIFILSLALIHVNAKTNKLSKEAEKNKKRLKYLYNAFNDLKAKSTITETSLENNASVLPVEDVAKMEKDNVDIEQNKALINRDLNTTQTDTSVQSELLSDISTVDNHEKTSSPNFIKPEGDTTFSTFFKKLFTIESIISKLGIMLLLIGVGYIFKLAYDNGYITKELAIITGIALGALTLFLAFKVHEKERIVLSQVLFGGGVAIFYITTYAAYFYYGMLNDIVAFFTLVTITVAAFIVSMMTYYASISIIALMGSIIIPFAVGLNFLGFMGFGLYILSISILSMVVYYFRQWRILQISALISIYGILSFMIQRLVIPLEDRQLLGLLIGVLWLIFSMPDLYFHIRGFEDKHDAFYSPVIAVVICNISYHLIFSLTIFTDIQFGYLSLLIATLYIITSYIIIKIKDFKNLGISQFSLGIITLLLGILMCVGANYQAVLILLIASFLMWLSQRTQHFSTRYASYITWAIGYVLILITLSQHYKEQKMILFMISALIACIPLIIIRLYVPKTYFKLTETFNFQIFLAFFIGGLVLYYTEEGMLYMTSSLAVTGLFVLYNYLHHKYDIFYRESLLFIPATLVLLTLFNALIDYNQIVKLTEVIVSLICASIFYIFAQWYKKYDLNTFIYELTTYLIIVKLLLFDLYYVVDDFRISLLVSGLLILILKKYYNKTATFYRQLWKISMLSWLVIMLTYYLSDYTYASMSADYFSIITLLINACVMLLFSRMLTVFKLNKFVKFGITTIVVGYLSITDVYIPLDNNGILTIIWAFYAIGSFVYYLKKGDKSLVYTALLSIVFVAAKLIVIDLNTISIPSKVITSIVFGSALLGLSYAIQPLMKTFSENEDNSIE